MVVYRIVFTKAAQKQIPLLKAAGLDQKARKLISLVAEDPYAPAPPYEKLLGDMAGAYSRRINLKHRLVYQVLEQEGIVRILSLWSHYEYYHVNEQGDEYGG